VFSNILSLAVKQMESFDVAFLGVRCGKMVLWNEGARQEVAEEQFKTLERR